MLSDEEREALDILSSKKNETTWDDTIRQIKREEIKDVVVTRQKYITTILNLIEKQSKEIEEIDEVLKGQLIEKIRVYFEAQKEVLQSLLEKKFPTTITKEELEERWKE